MAAITDAAARVLMTGTMHVHCAWCKVWLHDKPCVIEEEGKMSHGICDACKARVFGR
jgi:hypothetical protein